MRPIKKGAMPRSYGKYDEAQDDLINMIGEYCSYCERKINHSIAVEHKRPKSLYPKEILLWDNFLLACTNCNSIKGSKKIRLINFIWPDRDNTIRAFIYTDGVIKVNRQLPKRVRRSIKRTLSLLGLDRNPNSFIRPSLKDKRWIHRREAWDKAILALDRIRQNDSIELREATIDTAVEKGFFSIWMEVFKDDPDMRQRLINAFPGVATDCFDQACRPIARVGGLL